MNHLQQYLQKRVISKPLLANISDSNLGIIVVIPCYNEPDIISTLMSIEACEKPNKNVEIIIVINSHEVSDSEIVDANIETEININKWLQQVRNYTYHTIHIKNIPKKYAGVGYARKIGMDEAVRRFVDNGISSGIICSLDADTLIAENYFTEIEKSFQKKNYNACSIYFEHDIEGDEFPQEVYSRIIEYELHLRYYSNSLIYSGFPYYYHTIGSAFALTAQSYCMQGGMNKKQAGEDFYFLQKIMQMGGFYELNSTMVRPSPRPSDRVIFGTGPVIREYMTQPEKEFVSYNFEAFKALKPLFDDKMLFFKINNTDFDKLISHYHLSLQDFLNTNNFRTAIHTINNNIADKNNFSRKFFHWFDGFRVVKYLNFSHEKYFSKIPIVEATNTLISSAKYIKITPQKNSKNLLLAMRQLDKMRHINS